MFNFLSNIFGPSFTPKNPYTQIPKGSFRQTQIVVPTPSPAPAYVKPNIVVGNICSGKLEYPFNNPICSGYYISSGLAGTPFVSNDEYDEDKY